MVLHLRGLLHSLAETELDFQKAELRPKHHELETLPSLFGQKLEMKKRLYGPVH